MTGTITIISVAVLLVALVMVRLAIAWHTREFIRRATVEQVVKCYTYEQELQATIDDLRSQRAKDEAKAGEQKGRLKSHPIEKLQDEGVFNVSDMQELFLHQLQKTLIGYSQRDRQFIREVGMMAFNRTMIRLHKRALMKMKLRKPKGDGNAKQVKMEG